jgi:hypothetical protein
VTAPLARVRLRVARLRDAADRYAAEHAPELRERLRLPTRPVRFWTVKRDWSRALMKKQWEGRCRICGSRDAIELAHTVGRQYDEKKLRPADDPTKPAVAYLDVDPDDVVPLCRTHHAAYDAREVDLLPYLSLAEQQRAVAHVGIERAYRRLTGAAPPA